MSDFDNPQPECIHCIATVALQTTGICLHIYNSTLLCQSQPRLTWRRESEKRSFRERGVALKGRKNKTSLDYTGQASAWLKSLQRQPRQRLGEGGAEWESRHCSWINYFPFIGLLYRENSKWLFGNWCQLCSLFSRLRFPSSTHLPPFFSKHKDVSIYQPCIPASMPWNDSKGPGTESQGFVLLINTAGPLHCWLILTEI